MKIAVTGTHGVGKTTICKLLEKRYCLKYIPDLAREAVSLGFEINENTPPETQFWILSRQLELEKNSNSGFVADKPLYDNIIYGEYSIKDNSVLKVIKKIVLNNAKYDFVFYIPIEIEMEKDGVRPDNENFRKEMDQKILNFLKKNKIKYCELRGSVEKRLQTAIEWIDSKTKNLSQKDRN